MKRNLTRRELLSGVSAAALLARIPHAGAVPRGRGGNPSAVQDGPRTLITTFRVHNYGVAAVVHPQMTFAQPFAPGDVPGSHHVLVRKSNGRAIPSQQDQEATWLQDGSWKTAAISFVSPDTFAAGQTITYQLWSVPGTPNRAPNVTLAQLTANSDIKLIFTGYDLGNNVFAVSVNDIVANGTNFPWGSKPNRGWEVIRSGPVCTEWRFWSHFRRVSDGAWHYWLKGFLYVRAWGPRGPYEIVGGWCQPNIFGPSPDSAVGISATVENKHLFTAALYDGSTPLNYWGGANDRRVATGIDLATAVNTSNGQITLSRQQFRALLAQGAMKGADNGAAPGGGNGGRVPVVFSASSGGSLPAPLKPNTVYWIAGYYLEANNPAATQIIVADNAADAWAIKGMPLTSTGSGTLTITPLAGCFPFKGGLALDPPTVGRTWRNGPRIKSGAGSSTLRRAQGSGRPTLLVGHDFAYLTTKSRVLPPYLSAVAVNTTPAFTTGFSQGSTYYAPNLGDVGDAFNDDRIGWLTYHSCCELYRPFDNAIHQLNLAIAASWTELAVWGIDETVGVIPVINKTQYPDMPAPIGPGARYGNPPNYGNPGPITVKVSSAVVDSPGGGSEIGGNHSPCPQIMPYLKTGDHLWVESLMNDWCTMNVENYMGLFQAGGFTAYKPWSWATYQGGMTDEVAGGRGEAWRMRAFGTAHHFTPASRPEMPYLRDQMLANSEVPMVCVNNLIPAAAHALGNYSGINNDGGASDCYSYPPWFDDLHFMAWALEAWKGEYPGWTSFLENYFFMRVPGRVDEHPVNPNQPPGCIWEANRYWLVVADGSMKWYQTYDAALARTAVDATWYNQQDTGAITAGSNRITGLRNTGNGQMVPGQCWIQDRAYNDFSPYTVLARVNSSSEITTGPAPGTRVSGRPSTSRSNVTINYGMMPCPWPGIPAVAAQFPNSFNPSCQGLAQANNNVSYVCMLTAALAMGAVLHSVTGNPVFANCRAIYNEVRRRQHLGLYIGGPLDFTNAPKYAIGPIGATQ